MPKIENTAIDISNFKKEDSVETAVRTILNDCIGESNLSDEVLANTPYRVAEAYKEFFDGYSRNPIQIISSGLMKHEDSEELITFSGIEFTSFCEHHIVPFFGEISVSFIPDKHLVGFGTIAKLIDALSSRLQIQERLTKQIGSVIQDSLNPKGLLVVVDARHHCVMSRGVKKRNMEMSTQFISGIIKEDFSLFQRCMESHSRKQA